MALISDNLHSQKRDLVRLARGVLLGLVTFAVVDLAVDSILHRGLERYFGLDSEKAVLLVGHSHVVLGVDKERLETSLALPVAKYARAGAGLEDRIVAVNQYLSRHEEPPAAVVFGVDGHLFAPRGLSSNSYTLFYPFMEEPLVGEHIRAKARTRAEFVARNFIRLCRYDDVLLNGARRGLSGNWSNSISGAFDPERLARRVELGDVRRLEIDAAQLEIFRAFLERMASLEVPVILAFIPTTDAWNRIDEDRFKAVLAKLDGFDQSFANVSFVDLLPAFSHRHDLFADPIHLNPKGQQLVTEALSRRLAALLELSVGESEQ